MMKWTYQRTLEQMKKEFLYSGIETPRVDAELLLSEVLQCSRADLYCNGDHLLSQKEYKQIKHIIQRRKKREPVAYILQKQSFWKHSFYVDRSVLIPRQESELLVEQALHHISVNSEIMLLDLCTGSGCIAISLALERPKIRLVATDISTNALNVAMYNAKKLKVTDRIEFIQGDLFEALSNYVSSFDIIVANPPYIDAAHIHHLSPEVSIFEPKVALVSDSCGFAIHHNIAKQASTYLKDTGLIFCEIGIDQIDTALTFYRNYGFQNLTSYPDLIGIPRVIKGIKSFCF